MSLEMASKELRVHCEPTISENKNYLSYDDLKHILEQSLAALKKEEVEFDDDDFFEEVDYRIVRKTRATPEERSLVSEQNTQFENRSQENSEYQFTSSYEENRLFSVTSSKGHSIGLGCNLGGGYMGGSAGVSTGYKYGRQKGSSEGKGRANRKELSLTGTLKPQTLVIVKELVYEVRENADYNLVLTLSDKANIPFTSAKDGEKGSVELKKLIEKGKITSRAIEHVGKTVNMNFVGSCTYRSIEHALEVFTIPSGEEWATK